MREDYLEQLDKMFPSGYVIVYTCPNDTIRLGLYNPDGLQEIDEAHKHIMNWGGWKFGGDIKL